MTTPMPPATQAVCRNCGALFPRAAIGRPAQFCPDCRTAGANRARHRDTKATPANADQVTAVADEMVQHLNALADLTRLGAPSNVLLTMYRELDNLHQALGAATVQHSRAKETSWNDIGAALYMSPDTARKRWTPDHITKLLTPRHTLPAVSTPANDATRRTARPRTASSSPATGPAHHGRGTGDTPHAPDHAQAPPRPAVLADDLTTALSDLQRASGKTLKAIAHDAGVDPSYITRILAAERIPSWQVTRSIAAACNTDPAPLRPLWEAARGAVPRPRPPQAGGLDAAAALHDALCGLHLAAARPAPSAICEMAKGHLRTRDVAGLLDDGRIPDWHTVDQVVSVLRGHSDDLKPLWNQARQQTGPTLGEILPAASFG